MIRTIKATVAYDGTRYQGFQRQKNGVGVQQVLEKALTEVLKEPILIKAAGRTDAGVHALGQVISFATSSRIPPENYRRALEPHLPPDIAIREAEVVRDDFHARFDAVDKTYQYKIYYSPLPDPTQRNTTWEIREKLDVEAMNRAAEKLLGKHDFSAFCGNRKMKKSTVRRIDALKITRRGNELQITVTGDGFLYNMVRTLVGTLVEVGQSRRSPESIPALFGAPREQAGFLAPPQGLCLMEVTY